VLVTGGTGAVGAAACTRLLTAGHDIAFTYRSNKDAATEMVSAASAAGRSALALQVDLSVPEEAAAAVHQAALGGLSSLIHAAGPFVPQKYLSTVEPVEMVRHLHQETAAFFNVLAPALPYLRESSGSIVAVTTVAIRKFPIRDGLSPASKAGIESIVRAVAAEEGRFGIRANCVGPGLLSDGIAADLIATGQFDEVAQAHAVKQVPLRRFGAADEVAAVAVFLAGPEASYVSGQVIDVDGGYSI
jgi:NAD(P)-dependent dehydrogenase (short-subunit alcohol dehydrogenase family)